MSELTILLIGWFSIFFMMLFFVFRPTKDTDLTEIAKVLTMIRETLETHNTNLYRLWDDGIFIREHRAYTAENRKQVMLGKDIPNTYTTDSAYNQLILEQVTNPFEEEPEVFERKYPFDDNGMSLIPETPQRILIDKLSLNKEEFNQYIEDNLTDFNIENRDGIRRWFDTEAKLLFENESQRSYARMFFFAGYYAFSDQLTEDLLGGPIDDSLYPSVL